MAQNEILNTWVHFEFSTRFTLSMFQVWTENIKWKYSTSFSTCQLQCYVLFFCIHRLTIYCEKQSSHCAWNGTNKRREKTRIMSMIPFFPSLRPTVGSSIRIDADTPCDEESELREIEKEHVAWVRTNPNYLLCFLFVVLSDWNRVKKNFNLWFFSLINSWERMCIHHWISMRQNIIE